MNRVLSLQARMFASITLRSLSGLARRKVSSRKMRVRHSIYEFGHFRLNLTEKVLSCAGKPVQLTLKAFAVLSVLVEHNGHLVTRDDLMRQVWLDASVEEGNLSQAICALRRVLGEDHRDHESHEYIQTVARRGYRFIAPVNLQNEFV